MARTKWALDPAHSELGFKIKHLMITNVSGTFKTFNVEAEAEGLDFSTAQISLSADMNSITTNNEQRDIHLRASDFFEVEKHPELTFKSTSIEKIDSDSFTLYGDLTIKGITKPVKLNVEFNGEVKDAWGQEKVGFGVTGKINRNDWGVNFNGVLETGGLMLGEEVKINGEIQLVKQAATVSA
ncbi:MAG: hypothetical protein JWN76_3085 [Chitinophagaceae bacterium]|nr:hypothetical protein [Chitinophagaceae bacterium]